MVTLGAIVYEGDTNLRLFVERATYTGRSSPRRNARHRKSKSQRSL